MSTLRAFLRRHPKTHGIATTAYWVLHNHIRRTPQEPYRKAHVDFDRRTRSPISDVATAFFVRAIVEGGHADSTIIEIGAFSGERIRTLAALFPNADARGIDIGAAYDQPRELDGVTYGHFDAEDFAQRPGRPLVLSRSTLACMTAGEVRTLFRKLASNGYCIALAEPVPLFRPHNTFPRRRSVHDTYYHPYERMLSEASFETHAPEDYHDNASGLPFDVECFWFQYATPRTSS